MPCAGGMSGLYHALTGCRLPGGRLEAIAEGNALGRGPVVFEVNASAIDIVRSLAARARPFSTCSSLVVATYCLWFLAPLQLHVRVAHLLQSLRLPSSWCKV